MKDKKSMVMVIIVGITILLFLFFNTTVFAETGTVVTSDLRLRKEMSTSSEILELLNENQEVQILSEDGDWYKVKVNDNVGYVNKQYVKVKENSIITDNTTTEESKEENKVVEENKTITEEKKQDETSEEQKTKKQGTVKEEASIRTTPLINGDVINTAKLDQKFDVVNNAGAWSYVVSGSIKGWVLTQDLTVETVSADTPNEVETETQNSENVEEQTENKTENKEENKEENVEEQKVQNSETNYSSSKTYYVSGTSVNVRSEASKSSNVIKVLTTNNEVEVTGESDEWFIVSINGNKGYIAKSLLSTTKKEVTSRSSTTVNQNQYSEDEEVEEQETIAAPSGSAGVQVASYAQQFVGYPYVYGASGPSSFDCSGFAQYVYKQFGYSLNRVASAQASNGVAVSQSNLEPGDLVFFNTSGGISHVGIYIGGNQFVHASSSRTGVIISSLSQSYYAQRYVTARRIIQ